MNLNHKYDMLDSTQLIAPKKTSTVWIFGVVSTVCLAVWSAYFLLGLIPRESQVEDVAGESTETLDRSLLSGVLFMTLKDRAENSVKMLYSMDIQSEEKPRAVLGGVIDEASHLTEHLSPDANESVFSSVPWSAYFQDNSTTTQLYTADITNTKTQITFSDTREKRHPEWSPNGIHVIFMAHASTTSVEISSIPPAESYSIYITDFLGNEIYVDTGAYPQWLPSSTDILYMKDDGLVVRNLETGSTTQVVAFTKYPNLLNQMLDVSRDGKYIAWTNPDEGQVNIYKATEDSSNPRYEPYRSFSTHAFWPVFSEDGQYVAIQSVNWDDIRQDPQPKIVVFDVHSLEWLTLVDLGEFDQSAMFVTDWREL